MDSNKEYFITKELKNNNLEVKILGLSLILKRECSIIQNNKNSEDILEKENLKNLIEHVKTDGKKLLKDIMKDLYNYQLSDTEILNYLLKTIDLSEEEICSLIIKNSENAKYLANEGTPIKLSKLMLHILDIQDNSKILDAFSGEGNIGIEITKKNNVEIDGYEINEASILIARIKAYAVKKNIKYTRMDIFKEKIEKKYDYAISDIPFINIYDLSIKNSLKNISNEINFEIKNRISGSYICALKILEALNEHGKAIMTFVAGGLFNTLDKEIRKNLIKNNYIEEVINLPIGILDNSSLEIALVVFNKNKMDRNIKFVDLKECYIKKGYNNELDLDRAIKMYDSNYILVSENELIKNEFSLNPNIYLKKVEIKNGVQLSNIIVDIFRGYQITSGQVKSMSVNSENEANYKVLEISDISFEGEIGTDLNLINSKEKNFDRYLLKKGDIILSARGDKTKVAMIDIDEKEKIIANGSINVIRVDENKIYPLYLKMFFESEKGKITLNNIKSGITIPSLNIGDLQKIEVPCPPLEEQKKLVDKYQLKLDIIGSTKKRMEELKRELNDIVNII